MTSEELNRAIESIAQTHARIDAIREQSRKDRIEFKKWAESCLTAKIYFDDSDGRSKEGTRPEQERHQELLHETWASLRQLFKLLAEIPQM